ncbi:universal stress protein [Mycolicibacterium sp. P9-64]|uniref:universal stress protein n=1 Tax=Mycolicibacterium sp. P9-64 TaxID=2024612 RepID=UPI001563A64A|nr:universal stress protein [Mycolicibacterium sp. P9-64]
MKPLQCTSPIVVGIDGSQAAIGAALWAADEALSRNVPLRLVHVIDVEDEVDRDLDGDPAVVARDWPETERGMASLRAASAAVQDTGKRLDVETQILWGEIDQVLIKESETATMVCVGSVGIAPVCREVLGSTATTVVEKGLCPVAVIRTPHAAPTSEPDWIVAVVDDTVESDEVADFALEEAHLRRAPVLALGVSRGSHHEVHYDDLQRRVDSWRHDHPYVHIYPVSVPTDAAAFLAQHDELSVQLTVLGAAASDQAPAIVGPHRPSRRAHNQCSVLVVR